MTYDELWKRFCGKNPKILDGNPVTIRPERLCAFGKMCYDHGRKQEQMMTTCLDKDAWDMLQDITGGRV